MFLTRLFTSPNVTRSAAFLLCHHPFIDTKCHRFHTTTPKGERTYIMIKPDGVHRSLVGNIISRFEQKGFRLVGLKFLRANQNQLQQHYADLTEKPFYPGLIKYMKGPVVAMVWEGENAVIVGRTILGETDPQKSKLGTIRGDLCVQVTRNVCHGSDSLESAQKEIELWFKPEELVDWKQATHEWIH